MKASRFFRSACLRLNLLAGALLFPGLSMAGQAASPSPTLSAASQLSAPSPCPADSTATRVLVEGCTKTFGDYLAAFIDRIMPLVLFLALIMIVFSGVQYMLAGISPEGQKNARQRILGILTGVVFFLLIRLILNQLSPNIGIK